MSLGSKSASSRAGLERGSPTRRNRRGSDKSAYSSATSKLVPQIFGVSFVFFTASQCCPNSAQSACRHVIRCVTMCQFWFREPVLQKDRSSESAELREQQSVGVAPLLSVGLHSKNTGKHAKQVCLCTTGSRQAAESFTGCGEFDGELVIGTSSVQNKVTTTLPRPTIPRALLQALER